jgi:hypothetical protein
VITIVRDFLAGGVVFGTCLRVERPRLHPSTLARRAGLCDHPGGQSNQRRPVRVIDGDSMTAAA